MTREETMTRKVFVIGGPGCGTTHVYRIVCELWRAAGIRFSNFGASAKDIEVRHIMDIDRYVVAKSHDLMVPPYDALYRVQVFLCQRRPDDQAASFYRRVGNQVDVLSWIRWTAGIEVFYLDRNDVFPIDYEAFYGRDLGKVAAIASVLEVDLREQALKHVAEITGVEHTRGILAGLDGADPDTELRPDQIGPADGAPGAGKKLPEDFQRQIWRDYEMEL